jgi:hypothetical protein
MVLRESLDSRLPSDVGNLPGLYALGVFNMKLPEEVVIPSAMLSECTLHDGSLASSWKL